MSNNKKKISQCGKVQPWINYLLNDFESLIKVIFLFLGKCTYTQNFLYNFGCELHDAHTMITF